ncbi:MULTISPECIES: SGNH/GDSL hydrolase family protein [unclassified Janthinobacterium]|uniref:SGNH/GDSL hydrolase family protein n=1 Tax=unclassified Janthinobacterium TaxID=2610881 RepID=UPI00160E5A54|nr:MULTISPECIES: SGNH/GDSL hydrolase family protein [unclassified Janthinobacterium]MBB5368129.1 phospholipase/lecithinase/hemolysin [Janthinobacterium sp. K2C7]MBB5379393.1 phospholipase/lecithinase/hemolysin [Janthinobacterium sp. K2Li3]MBB5386511.1 phospholipase/lecithinase/hemolysin [Janthinobacterium sp. K2E3]
MHQTKFALAVLAAAVLAGCGGSTAGDQTLKVKYSAQVSFGDSLSDVGSYAVGTVAALKGGKFTINGDNRSINPELTGKNWTELMAAQFSLPAPCAAETGLDGDASQGFSVPIKFNTGCYGYAMGGSRVTNPVGPNNKLTGSALGALTVPVVTQISNHLAAVGGKFKGDEIVFVMAGGNDALFQLGALQSGATAAGTAAGAQAGAQAFAANLVAAFAAGAPNPATAAQSIGAAVAAAAAAPGATSASIVGAAVQAAVLAGNTAVGTPAGYGPLVAKAQADATATGNAAGAAAGAAYAAAQGPALVAAMATAGNDLVALVKNQIIANGATRVVVNNLPDIANTPSGLSKDASTKALINAMVSAYNGALNTLSSEPKVLVVDVFAVSHDQATNPAPYGLTNVTDTACDLTPAKNPLGSSLVCNGSNLKAGDVSHYSYADDVHPTPFNNLLLARYVSKAMVVKGWL